MPGDRAPDVHVVADGAREVSGRLIVRAGEHRRLDAWAMKKSWAHPCLDGYECKWSRSDFLRDEKVRDYLPLCNRLWFVCPSGLIGVNEIPEQMGLLWAPETGTRLMTKKKAPHREIAPPVQLLFYVLMHRSKITREYMPETDRTAFWREWADGKKTLKELGQRVASRTRTEIRNTVETAERRAEEAERRAERIAYNYPEVQRLVDTLGLDPSRYDFRQRIESSIAGGNLRRELETLQRSIDSVREEFWPEEKERATA